MRYREGRLLCAPIVLQSGQNACAGRLKIWYKQYTSYGKEVSVGNFFDKCPKSPKCIWHPIPMGVI